MSSRSGRDESEEVAALGGAPHCQHDWVIFASCKESENFIRAGGLLEEESSILLRLSLAVDSESLVTVTNRGLRSIEIGIGDEYT
jgi:hypothetical protein